MVIRKMRKRTSLGKCNMTNDRHVSDRSILAALNRDVGNYIKAETNLVTELCNNHCEY